MIPLSVKANWGDGTMKIGKCVSYKIDEETYTLFPLEKDSLKRYVIIDEASYEVFCLLKEGYTIDETVKEMLKRYDVDEGEFRADLQMILDQWKECGIVEDSLPERRASMEGSIADDVTDIEVYDKMYQAAIQKKEPFKVYFEITHECNLRCHHCYIQETIRRHEKVFLEKGIILKAIDELKEMGVHEIVITGGECTLHKDFLEIIRYVCDREIKLVLLTNGNLMNDDLIEKIKDVPIADVRISIYGTEKTHDEMTCVKGSFQKSFHALKALRKEKGIGTATILVTNDNFAELDELTSMFREQDIEYDFNAFIFPTTEQNMSPTNFRIENMIGQFVDKYVTNCSGSKCAAGISRFRVDSHGNVSPCDLLKHEKLGNLHEKGMSEIINSEEREKWLKKLYHILNNNECSKCENKAFCNSCLGLLYMEKHEYDHKLDFLCKFTEAKKEKYQRIMGQANVECN